MAQNDAPSGDPELLPPEPPVNPDSSGLLDDDSDMTSLVDAELAAFASRAPQAFELARLCCTAVQVEPALLRTLRLRLRPDFPAVTEVQLWQSPLVHTTSRTAFTFMPGAARRLREQLHLPPPRLSVAHESLRPTIPPWNLDQWRLDLQKARDLIRQHHGQLEGLEEWSFSSPGDIRSRVLTVPTPGLPTELLAPQLLQESLQWLEVCRVLKPEHSARFEQAQTSALERVSASILKGDLAAARWGYFALTDLPEYLRNLSEARWLEQTLKLRLPEVRGASLLPRLTEALATGDAALPYFALPRDLETSSLAVWQEQNSLKLALRDGPPDALAFPVPRSWPVFVYVGWQEDGQQQRIRLEVPENAPLSWPLPTAALSLTLHNGWGDGFSLEIPTQMVEVAMFQPRDRVLVINCHGVIRPPSGFERWSDLPVAAVMLYEPDAELEAPARLRAVPLDETLWNRVVGAIREQVEQALSGIQGRLHVFCAAPHALAAWVGRCLDEFGRMVESISWQLDPRQQTWKPFISPYARQTHKRQDPFFTPGETLEMEPLGHGLAFGIWFTQQPNQSQLLQLRQTQRLRSIRQLLPRGDGFISDEDEALKALEECRQAIESLRREAPSEPLHLLTSAPLAFMVELGRLFRPTVYRSVIIQHFDAARGVYYPVLDVVDGEVQSGEVQRERTGVVGPVRIFISYAREDLEHLQALEKHLANLKRQGVIEVWTDQKLLASTEWSPKLLAQLRSAQLVLVLISPDMMVSDFIHDIELKETLQRHEKGEVRVVPILLRPTDLKGHPLDRLQGLPRNFTPVTKWPNRDAAWVDVVKELRGLLEVLTELQPTSTSPERQSLSEQYQAALLDLKRLQRAEAPAHTLQQARRHAHALRDKLLQGDIQPQDILDGRFRLVQRLGQGGFASVWLAERFEDNVFLVLKILHSSLTGDPDRLQRFRRGSEQHSNLKHPNILKVLEPYRISSDDDTGREHVRRHYVVLEWAEQGDLFQWLGRESRSMVQRLDRVLEAAEALEYAHKQQTIHRDVKPYNILIAKDGRARLTDFDLAKLVNSTLLTRKGTAGTAFYTAPELQESAEGDELTPTSEAVDVYSLGWTLIALLKGKDITASDLVKREKLLQTLAVPSSAREVMLKAIEVDPADRYPTMQAFREALVGVRAQVRELPKQPSAPPPRPGPVRLSPAPVLTPAQALEAELVRLPLAKRLALLNEVARTGDPRLGLEKPENWIYLPPGEFRMGSDEGRDNEKPIHQVTLEEGFYLSRFLVTNHDFRPFVEGDGYRNRQWWSEEGWAFKEQEQLTEPGYWQSARFNAPNQPVVGISWFEAQAFCAWLNTQRQKLPFGEGLGKLRLPTEVEWEYAARGQEGRKYPWGHEKPTPERANYDKTGVGTTSPVGAFPLGATPEELLDLAGNVWEWCEDGLGPYNLSLKNNQNVSNADLRRVLRGGSWDGGASVLRGANRGGYRPSDRSDSVGFRVVHLTPAMTSGSATPEAEEHELDVKIEPGYCRRGDGSPALIESCFCSNCGREAFPENNAERIRVDGQTYKVFVPIEFPRHKDEFFESTPLICEECEHDEWELEFGPFCDDCQHMFEKDD